jgi:hypothetical protein
MAFAEGIADDVTAEVNVDVLLVPTDMESDAELVAVFKVV